jgi:hypothetical protein
VETLPFVDELSVPVEASADRVWASLCGVLRQAFGGGAWFAKLLGCEPLASTARFAGRPGETIPGFRVEAAEPGHRLALRGRHRFANYALTFVLDGDHLRAITHAEFPGLHGKLYRAAVIGTGAHKLVTRRLLRRAARIR